MPNSETVWTDADEASWNKYMAEFESEMKPTRDCSVNGHHWDHVKGFRPECKNCNV